MRPYCTFVCPYIKVIYYCRVSVQEKKIFKSNFFQVVNWLLGQIQKISDVQIMKWIYIFFLTEYIYMCLNYVFMFYIPQTYNTICKREREVEAGKITQIIPDQNVDLHVLLFTLPWKIKPHYATALWRYYLIVMDRVLTQRTRVFR